MTTARSLGIAPSVLRGRPLATTYEHDEAGRVVRTITEPAWTADDRALMLALQTYEDTLCSGCGHEKARAWHPDMDGWYEAKHYRCAACSAAQGRPVHYTGSVDEREPTDRLPDIPLEVPPPTDAPFDS